jgi:acyl-CoA synthetase (AMP-forming)/AMP-acid ligase II
LSAGKKIYPEEIEKIVSEFYPNHPEGFVGVLKDDDWHESLVWFSIPLSSIEQEKLRKVFRINLPSWKRPKKIIEKTSLPLTKSGKYQRR